VCDLFTHNGCSLYLHVPLVVLQYSVTNQRQFQKCVSTFAGQYCQNMEFVLTAGAKQVNKGLVRIEHVEGASLK
jgi:hypothetical protein